MKTIIVDMQEFILQGNMPGALRSDEEMEVVDKAVADAAFKIQKSKMDSFLQQKGFVKYKSNAYLRRNSIDVLEHIGLQKDAYGSKTFTVNYCLTPLYVPHSVFSYDLGDRLGKLICNRDVWWDYADEQAAEVSFQNVKDAIDTFLIPWFQDNSTKESLKQELLKKKKKLESIGVRFYQQDWIDAIENEKDYSEIISKNFAVLKLPKKLL